VRGYDATLSIQLKFLKAKHQSLIGDYFARTYLYRMSDILLIPTDAVVLNKLIHSRYSVFTDQFEPGKRIPDEIILQILENANRAPTHKRTEPWRFTVFTGDGLQLLAEKQAAIYKKYSGDKFKQQKYEKLLVTPQLCSHVIAIGMKRHAGAVPEIEEIAAVACAIENIYLTVAAYGIGGYISTGGITYIEEAKPFFNLEPEDKLIGFFYLGYVKIPSTISKREPVAEKTRWVRG
jgi:nitroreductase